MSGIGHIGELCMIEEFQKKINAEVFLPIKDVGIDFVAIINNNHFQIQVKTSMFLKQSYFWFDLYKSKMKYTKNTFYVFVFASLPRHTFMGRNKNYLIIPSLHIKKWIDNDEILPKAGNKNVFNMFVYPNLELKKWHYKNKGKEKDLTEYWNNTKYFHGN
jgi:hypothetical protein